jgi:hypothetical protein
MPLAWQLSSPALFKVQTTDHQQTTEISHILSFGMSLIGYLSHNYSKYFLSLFALSILSLVDLRLQFCANSPYHSLGTPPTDVVYAQLCKRHGLTPNSEVLEDGTQAHWIGPSSAEKVIINFHGICCALYIGGKYEKS